ncbi:kinesin motor domain-domain-containing protein [Syncephalastrum racemosum]|uniref:Kinesin-like protein n=1 Tax=Syncephalastrum racemosum TaxID=13706 RepID=A0A1X2H7K6_SYNRA|nr:kinesin motor domain-domain-containing protein [Syncephalastrum racemosum]
MQMGDQDQPGVIPRAVDDVFAFIEQDLDRREYMLRVSYLEIYNEQIRDLLSCNPSHENLKVVEQDSRMVVQGLIEEKVATRAEVLAIIKRGENNRHVGATDYNAHSSRSHAIFQMVVESRSKSRNVVRISQLNLIDLAGSEKATTDKNRLTEGRYINRSLLTLGNVIASLTNKKRRNTHVPYRDSILTRVLQTALSGNARISVICTVNPTTACKDESMNTLRFAQHAKQVQTSAKTTRISEHSVLQECLRTIADLQSKVREKDDQEAETHMRLARLMSLVLTSSKQEASTLIPNDMQNAFLSNGGMPNIELTSDLFARCEEHLTATLQEKEGLAMAMAKIADEKQALEVSMHEKDVLVSALTHSLREKEELISALSAALKQKDEDIAQKENHLSQKESHLSLFITAADNLQRELEDSKRREAETTQALKDAQSALDALAEKEKRKANKKAYMYDPLLPAGPWTFVFALVIYAWAS